MKYKRPPEEVCDKGESLKKTQCEHRLLQDYTVNIQFNHM